MSNTPFEGVRSRLATLALVAGLSSNLAGAQSPEEHAKHHPAGTAAPSMAQAGGGGMAGGEMGEMGEMMKEMGKAPRKAFYPSLMDLPELSPRQRDAVERQAHARMTTGARIMAESLGPMSETAARKDYPALQSATERMRQGLAQFESGLAAHRALAEGASPPEVALRWFKTEMNLAQPAADVAARTWFGVPVFHAISMGLIAAFALVMTMVHFARLRRARALATELISERSVATAPAPASTPPTPTAPGPISQRPDAAVPASAATSPPATTLRTPPTPTTQGSWSGELRVARIFQETADVKTFRLAPIAGEDLPFSFEPGQFMTIAAAIDGKTVKRSYSIASSPCCRGWCEITVKRAPGGAVSAHLHERIAVGDRVSIAGPYGRFTFRGETPSVVMIAGGVGITPMMSSIRYLTDQSWAGDIHLVYACASLDKVIFRDELDYLSHRHPNLHGVVVLSDEPSPSWTGERGRVGAELLARLVPDLPSRRIHVCGPPPMMDAVKAALATLGVPAEAIRTELFLAPERPAAPAERPSAPPTATCTFTRSGKKAALTPEKTVLEAAEEIGVAIDYSCRQGFCGECRTRLVSGQVTMAVEDGLSAQDKAAGYILACQAKSTSDIAVEA